jgi:hypothetical protein
MVMPQVAPTQSLASADGDSVETRPVRFSLHARRRAARRNVVPDAVEYVLQHGRCLARTGVTFYFLGQRDLPAADRRHDWAARLIGTVVLVASDGEIITVYRNHRAWRTIKRKLKYTLCATGYDHKASQIASNPELRSA